MSFVLGVGLSLAVGVGLYFGAGIFSKSVLVVHLIRIGLPVQNHISASFSLQGIILINYKNETHIRKFISRTTSNNNKERIWQIICVWFLSDKFHITHQFVAATQPINSLAFVFDGVNYGASDFAYSAYSLASSPTMICF